MISLILTSTPSSLSHSPHPPPLLTHLCVFSTSGQAAYEAAHVLHTPLADVLRRVCRGRVLPIHQKTSHRAWKSSGGWKRWVNQEQPLTVSLFSATILGMDGADKTVENVRPFSPPVLLQHNVRSVLWYCWRQVPEWIKMSCWLNVCLSSGDCDLKIRGV